MATNMPGTGLEAGSAKTTTDIFQLLFPRVAKTKKVIMFLRSPDCQKDLCRGSIPPFLYREFNSRLPIRGQTHGWYTILAPAHQTTVSPCTADCGTDHFIPFPLSPQKGKREIHPSTFTSINLSIYHAPPQVVHQDQLPDAHADLPGGSGCR